jgi:hypothetical protein
MSGQCGGLTSIAALQAIGGKRLVLTGRSLLDVERNPRLYELALVADRRLDAAHLHRTLDAENSPLVSLRRRIVTAWYTEVVGEGGARAVSPSKPASCTRLFAFGRNRRTHDA